MRSARLAVILFLIFNVATAQQRPFNKPGRYSVGQQIEQIMRESQFAFAKREAEKLRRELFYERQLQRRMREFAEAWNAFAGELNEHGTFNVKQCKRVNNAFERLQNTRGWLKQKKRKQGQDSVLIR